MKKILIAALLLFSITLVAQERREYTLIDQNTVEVLIFQNEILNSQGTMKLYDELWLNEGEWKQYDNEGNVNLTVVFRKGKIRILESLNNRKQVTIAYN